MKHMGAVESDSVKSARKAKGKVHKACERASETHKRTFHGQEQNRVHMASMRESRDHDRFLTHKYNHMHCCTEGLALQCLSFTTCRCTHIKQYRHFTSQGIYYYKHTVTISLPVVMT